MPDDGKEARTLPLRDGFDWVSKLTSGTATVADAEALRGWLDQGAEQEQSFAEAVRLRHLLRQVAADFREEPMPVDRRNIGRRAFVGGAMAAAAAGVLMVRPPYKLWPSLAEMAADYRTGAGERQLVTLGNGSKVEMNTRTSLAVGRDERIELVSGEAVISVPDGAGPALEMAAGDGVRVVARAAKFCLRCTGSEVRVTGLEGQIAVETGRGSLTLAAGHQISYDGQDPGRPIEVDTSIVTAWQRGLLIFRDTPLGSAIEEVNRYRPSGRIIVTDAALAQRPVNAILHLDQIDGVISQVERMGAHVTRLPGNMVLLG